MIIQCSNSSTGHQTVIFEQIEYTVASEGNCELTFFGPTRRMHKEQLANLRRLHRLTHFMSQHLSGTPMVRSYWKPIELTARSVVRVSENACPLSFTIRPSSNCRLRSARLRIRLPWVTMTVVVPLARPDA